MFCPSCGAQLGDNAKFCPSCGAAIAVQPQSAPQPEPQYQQPAQPQYQEPQYQQPQYQEPVRTANSEAQTSAGRSAMILAIVGLALSELGLPGLIISAIAKKKVKAYTAQYGAPTGMAKVAKILSTVGLIISIIMMVFWAIYIIVAIVAAIAAASMNSYTNDLSNELNNFFNQLQ